MEAVDRQRITHLWTLLRTATDEDLLTLLVDSPAVRAEVPNVLVGDHGGLLIFPPHLDDITDVLRGLGLVAQPPVPSVVVAGHCR
ncbi:hypothetical protein AB0P21_18615 [Kribbella sp. NPDC056861]|uniref:hypothetical protein n=1 Tax=Kribbella sp. NPDC056861 TaxID=3154857 RepID=UPI0034365346